MRTVLVPLDFTSESRAILPEAIRLAGSSGEIVLFTSVNMYDAEVNLDLYRRSGEHTRSTPTDIARSFLEKETRELRRRVVRVRIEPSLDADPVDGVLCAVRAHHVDAVACATHGRSPFGRLLAGSVVWPLVRRCPVPLLLLHPPADGASSPLSIEPETESSPGRILVPLDDSRVSERALPFAAELAQERHATIYLVHVLPHPLSPHLNYSLERAIQKASDYLDDVAAALSVQTKTAVLLGDTVRRLRGSVRHWNITTVVMTSHGRTGLARVVLGSVADNMIHELHCPTIVIPPAALTEIAASTRARPETPVAAAAGHP
jgi:nucleotide-binding universal stress UspA family protein